MTTALRSTAVIVICALIGFLQSTNRCSAQIYGPSMNYHVFGDSLIAQVRTIIEDRMSASDRALDSQISYVVSDSGEFNAYAMRKTDGRRVIVVNAGMIAGLDFLAMMGAAVLPSENFRCESQYVAFLSDAIKGNTLRVLNGQSASGNLDPFTFMQTHKGTCPQVTLQQMAAPGSMYTDIRDIVLTESTKWLLLHEFAHHRYGDVDSTVEAVNQQMREQRADEYAIKAMLNPPETPVAGFGAILLFTALEDANPDDQGHTHPAAIKRLKDMMQASHQYLTSDEFRRSLAKSGPKNTEAFNKAMRQWEEFVSEAQVSVSP